MKYCSDCNQEKPYDPSAPPRTKASGFYGWHCWDCHKQNALGRLHKRTDIQDPEYEALRAELEALTAELRLLKAQIRAMQEAHVQATKDTRKKAQNEARSTRPKALPKKALSLPYGELAKQAQYDLDQFLQVFPKEHKDFDVRKRNLEYKLEYAQKKLALFGPYEFDVAAKVPEKYEESHE